MSAVSRRIAIAATATTMLTAGLLGTGASPASAAFQDLPCSSALAIGNTLSGGNTAGLVQGMVNQQLPYSYKISSLKTLKIKSVRSLSISAACRVDTTLNVTLERYIRQDASGTIDAHANLIGRVDWAGADTTNPNPLLWQVPIQACVTGAYVDDVTLSNTFRIGEAAYKIVANKVIPENKCVTRTVSLGSVR